MKPFIQHIIILLMALNLNNCHSQSTEEIIKQIRKDFAEIETKISDNTLKQITLDFSKEESNSYGTTTYFLDNGKLRKIIYDEIINEENNQKTSYYIKDGKLFFAYHVSTAPRMIDATNTEYHYTENRYYFNNESSVRCLSKYYVVKPDSKENSSQLSTKTPNEEIDCADATGVLSAYNDLLITLANGGK